MSECPETVFACLTPAGAGAIATLAIHGPNAWRVSRNLFTPTSGELPEAVAPGQFFLGQLGEELRDEAILTLRRAEPVPWVELHCHGGREILAVLAETLRRHGLRELSWSEWHHWTIASAVRASAAVQLARALTKRTAAILLDQYHGAFDSALDFVREAIAQGHLASARGTLAGMLRHSKVGLHLVQPWRVAVAGATNAGKSSLVNALAGFERCVVSEIPGTTRDIVTTLIAIDGWPVELADTAGLREPGESLEEEGMRLARQTAATADLCVWVLDSSTAPVWPAGIESPLLAVVNKSDLPAAWDVAETLCVSARTGEGLAKLCEAIAARLVPEPPAPGAALPITEEWCARLDGARRACLQGKSVEALAALG